MQKRRMSISVTFDPDVVAAGRAAVAEGRAWSFSAWINQAARRQMADEGDAQTGAVGSYAGGTR